MCCVSPWIPMTTQFFTHRGVDLFECKWGKYWVVKFDFLFGNYLSQVSGSWFLTFIVLFSFSRLMALKRMGIVENYEVSWCYIFTYLYYSTSYTQIGMNLVLLSCQLSWLAITCSPLSHLIFYFVDHRSIPPVS